MTLRVWPRSERRRPKGVDGATRRALQCFVLPVWIGAGLADWQCRRRTEIEHMSGATGIASSQCTTS